ncbi:MAG: Hsp33 family molecular chaperone HslO [Magnetovibrionaceae bacterium]
MSDSEIEAEGFNDGILPFQLEDVDIRGRLIRLGPVAREILAAHAYPQIVSDLLGETLALTAALASGLKYEGIFTLQVQGDGPINLLVADITSEGVLRGYARFDEEALDKLEDPSVSRLLGAGHIAFTVDQGPDMERYQGITEITGATLADCANAYFRQSEQLDTLVKLAADDRSVAALLIQRLPPATPTELAEEKAEEDWRTAAVLAGSLTRDEMLSRDLTADQLLYRLFNEGGVRVFDPRPVSKGCRCSEAKIVTALAAYPVAELKEMAEEDGLIHAACEFCNTTYKLDPETLGN